MKKLLFIILTFFSVNAYCSDTLLPPPVSYDQSQLYTYNMNALYAIYVKNYKKYTSVDTLLPPPINYTTNAYNTYTMNSLYNIYLQSFGGSGGGGVIPADSNGGGSVIGNHTQFATKYNLFIPGQNLGVLYNLNGKATAFPAAYNGYDGTTQEAFFEASLNGAPYDISTAHASLFGSSNSTTYCVIGGGSGFYPNAGVVVGQVNNSIRFQANTSIGFGSGIIGNVITPAYNGIYKIGDFGIESENTDNTNVSMPVNLTLTIDDSLHKIDMFTNATKIGLTHNSPAARLLAMAQSIDGMGNVIFCRGGLSVNIYDTTHTAPRGCIRLMGGLIGASSTPTIAAGTGAGTTPTVSVQGTNLSGLVTVTTGSAPAGTNAIVATITYAGGLTYPTDSYVVLYPANALTATLSGISMVYATGTTTTFVITSGTTALTGASTYLWNYSCSGQ